MRIRKKILRHFIVILFVVMCCSSNVLAGEEVSRLTIGQDLNLVEQRKVIKLGRGVNQLVFGPISEKAILDSVYPRAEGCEFLEQEYISDSLISWKVRSEIEGETLLKVVYLVTGLTWMLNYQVKVDREAQFIDLFGWANIENKSGIDFSQVYLTLKAEDENFIPYSLPYPVALKNGEKKRIKRFSYTHIPVKKIFLFDAERYGEEIREELVFDNVEESGLGEFLPPGEVYIYKVNSEDKLSFIDKDKLDLILPQEKGSIYLGQARGVRGERIQTFYRQLESSEKEYSYRIILYNFQEMPVKVKVVEHFYGEWEILETYPPDYTREDSTIVYEVEIPPEEKQEIQYKARVG